MAVPFFLSNPSLKDLRDQMIFIAENGSVVEFSWRRSLWSNNVQRPLFGCFEALKASLMQTRISFFWLGKRKLCLRNSRSRLSGLESTLQWKYSKVKSLADIQGWNFQIDHQLWCSSGLRRWTMGHWEYPLVSKRWRQALNQLILSSIMSIRSGHYCLSG